MKNETDREKIIELVEKLLAMTEDAGCTQAEAVQFALKAQRLIAEHDISEDELGQRRGCGEIGPVFARSARREWRSLLALAIAENFRCKTYLEYCKTLGARRNVKVVFYGYESDARAAAFTFDHLYDAGHRLAREQGERAGRDSVRAARVGEGGSSQLLAG